MVTATATGSPQTITFFAKTGTHRYSVTATDSSENESNIASARVVADATAPATKSLAIEPGSPTDARSQVSLSPGEFTKYLIKVDGATVKRGTVDAGTLNLLFPLANGSHRLQVRLTDRVGNISTVSRPLRVAIRRLQPEVEHVTDPTSVTQTFKVTGSPGSRGTLRVGNQEKRFVLRPGAGASMVDVDLPDGSYAEATVALSDQFGRRGSVTVPTFDVDTVVPDVTVLRRNEDGTTGRLVAAIAAEDAAEVAWRVVDQAGNTVESATYTSTGATRTVDLDVEKGTYSLEVSATDNAGNTNSDELTADVAADPLSPGVVIAGLLLLLLILIGLVVLWLSRRRIAAWHAARKEAAAVAAAQRQYQATLMAHDQQMVHYRAAVAAHQNEVSRWAGQKERLTALLAEARTETGAAADSTVSGLKLKPGERVYPVVGATMVEWRTKQNVPYLADIENGRLTVTSTRVFFQGDAKKREWKYDKLSGPLQHRGEDVTLMPVPSVRKTLSGVRYADADRTRMFLDLAIADLSGERDRVVHEVGQRLHAHESTRPTPPMGPPPRPEPPALRTQPSTKPAAQSPAM